MLTLELNEPMERGLLVAGLLLLDGQAIVTNARLDSLRDQLIWKLRAMDFTKEEKG